MLAPISWRTPPLHYGPWEHVTSRLAEGLVARGIDVTLFATADSITSATLADCVRDPIPKTQPSMRRSAKPLHVAHVLERAAEFDLIHNHLDCVPLGFSRQARRRSHHHRRFFGRHEFRAYLQYHDFDRVRLYQRCRSTPSWTTPRRSIMASARDFPFDPLGRKIAVLRPHPPRQGRRRSDRAPRRAIVGW